VNLSLPTTLNAEHEAGQVASTVYQQLQSKIVVPIYDLKTETYSKGKSKLLNRIAGK